VMKAAFPLVASDVGFVLGVLRAAGPRPRGVRSADELAAVSPELLAVRVHKRREHYVVGSCLAELTQIKAPRGTADTIAVESEDPARLAATVRELGLDPRRNVCVARGLKALVGFGARRYAVLDVGSNFINEMKSLGHDKPTLDQLIGLRALVSPGLANMPLMPYVGMPAFIRKRPSVAPALIIGATGTPGHSFAAISFTGPMISSVSGGGDEPSRRRTIATFTCSSPMAFSSVSLTCSGVVPCITRHDNVTFARCGKAFGAWPPSICVATHVVCTTAL